MDENGSGQLSDLGAVRASVAPVRPAPSPKPSGIAEAINGCTNWVQGWAPAISEPGPGYQFVGSWTMWLGQLPAAIQSARVPPGGTNAFGPGTQNVQVTAWLYSYKNYLILNVGAAGSGPPQSPAQLIASASCTMPAALPQAEIPVVGTQTALPQLPPGPQPLNPASVHCGQGFQWVHQTNAAQLTAPPNLVVPYVSNMPPGIYFFTYQGQTWKYVNNMDGSVGNEPIPPGNTGLFICSIAMRAGMPVARGVGEAPTGVGQPGDLGAYSRVPVAVPVDQAANNLVAALQQRGCVTVPFPECSQFQSAYNAWIGTNQSIYPIAVDGEYGPCTRAALAALQTVAQGYILNFIVPASCFAGSCVNGKYVPPTTPMPVHMLPSKYRSVYGVGQLPATAQATLNALQGCSGQWQYTPSPENAQANLGNGIVPASSLPSGLRDALQCASLADGVPPAIPDVFQLPILVYQGPSGTMYVLISYGQWSGTFACVATQAAPASAPTGVGVQLPGAGTHAVPRRETGFQPGPMLTPPNFAQPGTLQSGWYPINAAQVPASVLQKIQGGATPGWGNSGFGSPGSAPMITGNQTLYGPYYDGGNVYAIVSTPQQNQWGGYYSSDQWYVLSTPVGMMSGHNGDAMTGVGQSPNCAQFGLPQTACDTAYSYVQAYQSSGGTAPDPTNVLNTFKQWYTAATGQAPTPVLDITQPPASTFLSSAFSYWTQFASQNPAAAAAITAWNFPWQYVPQGSATDPSTAIISAIMSMLQTPGLAQVLNQGQLPAFDPTQIANWATVFSDPATFATLANGVAAMIPSVETFVQLGSQCSLFSQSPAIVQQAFTNYMTYGGNPQDPRGVPCNATGPTGGPPVPTGPTGGPPVPTPPAPAPGPVTPPVVIQGQVPSPTPAWVPYAVAAGGALVVGALVYAFTRPSAHPGGATENPLSYAGWRASVANQLVNRYEVPYRLADQILDMPGPSGESMALDLFTAHVTPSQAASRIAMAYHQRAPALHG